MPSGGRLRWYLNEWCGSYRRRDRPTYSELASLCGCSASAIGRIASGKTKAFPADITPMLNALACIHLPLMTDNLEAEIPERLVAARKIKDKVSNSSQLLTSLLEHVKIRHLKRLSIIKNQGNL